MLILLSKEHFCLLVFSWRTVLAEVLLGLPLVLFGEHRYLRWAMA